MTRPLVLYTALLFALGGPARADETPVPAELTLDTALRIGRAHQPQLRQAQALSAVADARVDEVRAPMLPQVNVTAGYLRRTGNPIVQAGVAPPPDIPSSWNTYGFFTSGISASQLLWDFGQVWQRRKAARATADAQKDTERTTQLNTDLAIRAAFFTARTARDAVGVAREALSNQNTHVEQIKAFTEVGTRPQIDLLQAQADQANSEVSLINAQNDYATARAILNQTMGVEVPATYEVVGQPTGPVEGENGALDPLVDEAVRARPEVATVANQVRAQELTNKATADRYFPALIASTGLTYAGQDLNQLNWNWSGGLTLSWPLVEGGLVRATQREGDANLLALRAQTDILRQQIRVDVDAARLAIAAAKAALSASERSLANARGRLELAEVRYRTGVGNGIELSDAQLAATNAAFQVLQATLKLDNARALLQKALGRP